ncbi:glycosyltransferase family 2 protein [Verrucomicrobiales bacterium]|nr:glycosyltransferase family 2 protein [Verrucomicrobiales bacterium]MDC0275380.1 glycosyltransferase family 2 protein [Verrucomicrobiales bacterium]MDC0311904.1 glycosyltransferase family 2 protein [bacterium]
MNLTFVFPCLNEAGSLQSCIRAVRESLDKAGDKLNYEIVVADNGSTDDSAKIALEEGARVVPVDQRGYGAALRGGIEAAQGEYVMFADADSTYLYENALTLYDKAIECDADMSIASRMTGEIESGAMPWLHRRLGTPVLTGLINLLFKGKLSDCNSGFRCIRKSAYESWGIRASGMEFASELLIKALKHKAKMVEIPSGLRRGPEGRVAHLQTWRDGMRHLLFILSERPRLFEWSGLVLIWISSILQLLAMAIGPVNIGVLHIFDLHSKGLLLLAGITGMQLYVFSCMLFLKKREKPTRMTNKLIEIGEGPLFFFLLSILVTEGLLVGFVVLNWVLNNFANLDLTNVLIGGIHLLGLPLMLAIGLLGIHVFKKSDDT